MEEFLTGVGLAAVGGVGFLAYHHPDSFRRLARLMVLVSGGILAGMASMALGAKLAFDAISPYLPPKAAELLESKAIASALPAPEYAAFIPIALGIMLVLCFIPTHADRKRGDDV